MLKRLAGVATSLEIVIVLAIAPVLLFPTPTRLIALSLVPVLWSGAWLTSGRAIPQTPLNPALGLLLMMVAVSLYATFDIRFSLGKVSGVILGVVMFWAVTRWTTTRQRLEISIAAFLVAGGALAIVGLLGTNWIDKFPMLGAVIHRLPKAIRGVPGAEEGFHPNAVAGCLVLFVPLQVALLSGRLRNRVLESRWITGRQTWTMAAQAVLLALTAGTLVLTQSRGAWLGMLAALLAFLSWHSRQTRALTAVAVLSAGFAAWSLGLVRVLNLAVSQAGPGMAGDVSGRLELWSRAIYAIADFPFTGMGMNTFRKLMPVLYPPSLIPPDIDVAHAHNHLLQAALDLGLPGLIAYAALWLLTSTLLVAVYRDSTVQVDRTVARGLIASLIAHFSFGMTDTIPLGAKVGVAFWLTLALAVALHRVAFSRVDHQSENPASVASSKNILTVSSE